MRTAACVTLRNAPAERKFDGRADHIQGYANGRAYDFVQWPREFMAEKETAIGITRIVLLMNRCISGSPGKKFALCRYLLRSAVP